MESNERCAEEALSLRLSRRLTIPSTGATPAKYMATTWIGGKYFVKAMGGGGRTHRLNNISHKHGGNMIDHPDEDPMVRAMYEEELKKNGVEARMPPESYPCGKSA